MGVLDWVQQFDKYFRIGHMGISVVEPPRGDVDKIISSLGEALREVGEEDGLKVLPCLYCPETVRRFRD
jgi:aspartate aminotransferase-like enzyme